MKKLYNIKESSEYLGINRSTFNRWLDIGLIQPGYPVSKTSQRRVWTKTMLDKVLETVEKNIIVRS
jgi:predicted site-specific integrase-resolvase